MNLLKRKYCWMLIVLLPNFFFYEDLTAQGRRQIKQYSRTEFYRSVQMDSVKSVITFKIKLADSLSSAPIYNRGVIFISNRKNEISCIDTTGKVFWKNKLLGEFISRPVIADHILAVGTINGDIITLNANTGEQIQSIGINDTITTDLISLEYKGDKELMIPKSTGSKTVVVFGTASGKIFCYDLETLQEYWNADGYGLIKSQPVVIENKILFASSDGYLYCIDSRSGLLIWRWKEKTETDFSGAQILSDGKKVFVVSKDNILYCIDLLLGKLIWKADRIKALPAIGLSRNKKNLFVKSADKKFVILSADKGKVIKEIKQEEAFDDSPAQPIDREEKIFFTNRGNIYSFDPKMKQELILNLNGSQILFLTQIGEKKFITSNSAGTIAIFKLR